MSDPYERSERLAICAEAWDATQAHEDAVRAGEGHCGSGQCARCNPTTEVSRNSVDGGEKGR